LFENCHNLAHELGTSLLLDFLPIDSRDGIAYTCERFPLDVGY
jgi:hypothetical protein